MVLMAQQLIRQQSSGQNSAAQPQAGGSRDPQMQQTRQMHQLPSPSNHVPTFSAHRSRSNSGTRFNSAHTNPSNPANPGNTANPQGKGAGLRSGNSPGNTEVGQVQRDVERLEQALGELTAGRSGALSARLDGPLGDSNLQSKLGDLKLQTRQVSSCIRLISFTHRQSSLTDCYYLVQSYNTPRSFIPFNL